MIHYVVIAGRPESVDRFAPRAGDALVATRCFDDTLTTASAPDRSWHLAALDAPDRLCRERRSVRGDSVVVLNGPALATRGHQRDLIPGVHDAFVRGGSIAVSERLGGSYNFVGVHPMRGLVAFGDFSGLAPLYWWSEPGLVIVSNRSSTVAALAGRREYDLRALAWLIGHNNLFGDIVPNGGVRYLPPGFELQLPTGASAAKVCRSELWMWPGPDERGGRDNLTSAEWDEVTDELISNFRALGGLEGDLRLGLTGGKDTRLCLALAKAAGLGDRLNAVTFGTPDSPEVEAAKLVAESSNVPHRTRGNRLAPPPTPPAGDAARSDQVQPRAIPAEAVWRRLRQHAYRFEAIVCPWDGSTERIGRPRFEIMGFGGELYRGSHSKRFRNATISTVDEMAEMFVDYHQPHDPLRVLRDDVEQFQSNWLRNWVREAAEDVRFDLLPEKFYVDHRLGHWNGPLAQDKFGYVSVNPLLSPKAARKNAELKLEVRTGELLHYEVMRRAAPELVELPFLGDAWSPVVRQKNEALPAKPLATKQRPSTRVLKPWQWGFLLGEADGIDAVLAEARRETDMPSIANVGKLRQRIRRDKPFQRNFQAKAMVSSIYVALVLLGRVEAVYDEVEWPPPEAEPAG